MNDVSDGSKDDGAAPQQAMVAAQLARLDRTLRVAIGIALAILVLAWAGQTIILIFAGLLFGTVLHGLSEWLGQKTGIPHVWSLTIVCVAIAAVVGLAGWWVGPHVIDQLGQLGEELRSSWDSVLERLRRGDLLGGLTEELTLGKVASQIHSVLGGLMNMASTLLAILGGIVVIVFISIYTAASPQAYTAGPIAIIPPERRTQVRELFGAIAATLQWWFLARVMSMTIVGVLTGLGLWLIGMPLFIALGVLAAGFSFVPYLGPVASAVPAILIGFAHSPTMALYVVLLYIAVQTAESYLITPQLMQRAIHLPAAAVLMMQLLFGVFFGILGVAFASPISATILAVLKKTVRRPDTASHS